jgi:hypothetical protein
MALLMDNILIENNSILAKNTNGDLNLVPNGDGEVIVPIPVSGSSAAQKEYVDQSGTTTNFLLMGA